MKLFEVVLGETQTALIDVDFIYSVEPQGESQMSKLTFRDGKEMHCFTQSLFAAFHAAGTETMFIQRQNPDAQPDAQEEDKSE